MAVKPVSVTTLNKYIKQQLALDPILSNVPVTGEISGLTKHSSGHWYFSLKDKESKINCFLGRDRVRSLRYDLSEGMQIICFGAVSVYVPGGYYSLNIRDIQVEGEGDLSIAFENLKKKLADEGLFDEDHKKPLPEFPRHIAVLTSPTGAAVHDIITTVRRRNPFTNLLIYPCLVQGPDAAASIADGLAELNRLFPDLDLIIAGRGGGSKQDLWAFNEEIVARAIYDSKIPVISAVGHEVDFLISDYVADVRGATPTAAAELAVPHIENFKDRIRNCSPERMYSLLTQRIDNAEIKLAHYRQSCGAAITMKFTEAADKLKLLKLDIDSANPANQLERGFAVVKNAQGGWLCDASGVKAGDRIKVLLRDGELDCLVENPEVYDEDNRRAEI